jgi:hypothetical protein
MKTTSKLPDDSALPGLAVIRSRGLDAAVPSLGLGDPDEVLLCGYSPGDRATLEVRAGGRHVAVKVYAEDPTLEGDLYEGLAAQGLAGDTGVRTPRLLARAPDLKLFAISWLEGRTAHELLKSGEGERAGELAARWLQRAASLPLTLGPSRGAEQMLERTDKWVAHLAAADRGLGTAAESLAGILARTQPEEPVRHLVHGRLYDRHILDLGDGPGLIDWQRFGQGPLELDAGMFLATLFRGMYSGSRLAAVLRAQEAFLAGIAGVVDEGVLAWHWAAALLHLAARKCKPARRKQVDYVARAEAMLGEALRLAEGAASPESEAVPDAAALLARDINAAVQRSGRGNPVSAGEPPLAERLAAALCGFKGWTLELVLHALSTQRATPEELEQIRKLLDEMSDRAPLAAGLGSVPDTDGHKKDSGGDSHEDSRKGSPG